MTSSWPVVQERNARFGRYTGDDTFYLLAAEHGIVQYRTHSRRAMLGMIHRDVWNAMRRRCARYAQTPLQEISDFRRDQVQPLALTELAIDPPPERRIATLYDVLYLANQNQGDRRHLRLLADGDALAYLPGIWLANGVAVVYIPMQGLPSIDQRKYLWSQRLTSHSMSLTPLFLQALRSTEKTMQLTYEEDRHSS